MKDLIKSITTASNIINERAKKGGNFIIVSPKVAEAINNLDPEYRRMIRKKKLDKINEAQIQNNKEE